jgi:hypothetical protein
MRLVVVLVVVAHQTVADRHHHSVMDRQEQQTLEMVEVAVPQPFQIVGSEETADLGL